MKKKTRLFSLQLTDEDNKRLKEIAEHKGVTMSGAVRIWIRETHRAMDGGLNEPV